MVGIWASKGGEALADGPPAAIPLSLGVGVLARGRRPCGYPAGIGPIWGSQGGWSSPSSPLSQPFFDIAALPQVAGGLGEEGEEVGYCELDRGQKVFEPQIGCELADGDQVHVRSQRTVRYPAAELFQLSERDSVGYRLASKAGPRRMRGESGLHAQSFV